MVTNLETHLENPTRQRRGNLAVNLGLIVNIFLAGAKTAIGILGHSPALLADGINSVSDVAYYIVVSVFMRLAYKPADDEHPYGHNQLETIAALIVGAFVVTTGITVFWDSVDGVFELFSGASDYSGAAMTAMYVALGTVGVKIFLTFFTRKIGRETSNPVVMALSDDHRNDVFTASAATLGIFLGRAGYPWVDPLAGALVALLILRTGVKILVESATELMDAVPGKPMEEEIKGLICPIPGVKDVEEIKAHRFGPYYVTNLTIGVEGQISVVEGDCIASQVEQALMEGMPLIRRVHVHYHPVGSTNGC